MPNVSGVLPAPAEKDKPKGLRLMETVRLRVKDIDFGYLRLMAQHERT